jgi:endonuclease YncB( thermonuclease family)
MGAFVMGAPAHANDEISGSAHVIDADILRIDQQRVILWGLDAPERDQPCYKDGQKWGCHGAARRTLELLAGRGEVVCYLLGDPDPFNRRHGVCESGGTDINGEMVNRGMAVAWEAQSSDYVEQQLDAIENERGIWSVGVEFILPWEYRRLNTPGGYR